VAGAFIARLSGNGTERDLSLQSHSIRQSTMTPSPLLATCLALLSWTLIISLASGFADVMFRSAPSRTRHSFLCASSSLQHVFTEELSAAIAEEVQKRVEIPFVPQPIVLFVMTQAIQNLSSDLSEDTLQKIQEMLEAESTESTYDDTPKEERDALADQVARELNAKIDVPMFDEVQELEVLKQIMRVVLQVMTTTDVEVRNAMMQTQLEVGRDILGGDESRAKLVQAINAAVDVPILGESEEEAILTTAVGMCAELLQTLLPPDLIETLKGESPEGLLRMKEYLITTVNAKVDLVGLSEEQEQVLVEKMVEILIDTYVDDTEAEFLLLTKEEQQSTLEEKATSLNREMESSTRRYQREQQNLAAQLERIQLRLQSVTGKKVNLKAPKKAATNTASSGKRSRLAAFFRRGN